MPTILQRLLVVFSLPLALSLSGDTVPTLTLAWNHPSIGQPAVATCLDPKSGQPLLVTNVVVTFFVYESSDLANWNAVATAIATNRATVLCPPQSAFYAVTSSNSCEGESSFSSIMAWQPSSAPSLADSLGGSPASVGMIGQIALKTLTGNAPFLITSGGSTFQSVVDDSLLVGYNYGDGGVRANTNDISLGFNLESNYRVGVANYAEWNFGITPVTGAPRRFLDFQVDRANPDAHGVWNWGIAGDGFFRVFDLVGNGTTLLAYTNGSVGVGFAAIARPDDRLEVRGAGNVAVRVTTARNGDADYAALRLVQGGATRGQLYTHSDATTLQALTGPLVLASPVSITLAAPRLLLGSNVLSFAGSNLVWNGVIVAPPPRN